LNEDALNKLQKKDVTIIGSGIASLCLGALLSETGYNVCILESHPSLIGGHARSIHKDGFNFCPGPQYVWYFDKEEIGHRFLKFLGIEKENIFDYMDENGFESIYVGNDNPINLPMGLFKLEKFLTSHYKEYEHNIKHLIDHIKVVFDATRIIAKRGLAYKDKRSMRLEVLLSNEIPFISKLSSFRFSKWSLLKLMDHCGIPEHIKRVIFGNGGIYAENFSSISAVMFCGATGSYNSGAQYPRFGFKKLISSLVSKIESNGGSVETNKKVIRIEEKNHMIEKVVCADGTSYKSDIFISNISPRLTCELIHTEKNRKFKYEPSNPLTTCLIGVSDYPELKTKLSRKNIWFYPNNKEVDYERPNPLETPRMLYIGSPTLNGDYNKNENPEHHSIITFSPGNYEQAKQQYELGEQAYSEYCHIIQDQILSTIDELIIPGIKKHIKVTKIITPWDLHEELGCEKGNVYGKRLTAASILRGVGDLPKIENLHFASATMGMPGIVNGVQNANFLLNKIAGIQI
jgi:all-trans-retinol 13,14-reductase